MSRPANSATGFHNRRWSLVYSLVCSLALFSLTTASAQVLTEWTEAPGTLGLGYPVPLPQGTALPFAGFRSYAGLFERHQDLAASSDDVAGVVVGQTENGREIWSYLLSDANALTATGLPEPAALTQGGIHAREWQSPEVVTGIMEQLVAESDDQYLHRYLLDNVNLVLTPVLNVDGFLQTQRFPTQVQLTGGAPRDGRMRRKNMRTVDEDLLTTADHLLGIDLNRNNPPYWATSSSSSSAQNSIVHHGSGPQSESETQAMVAAAELGPAQRLRMYTDVHSFGQVHFSVLTDNSRRNAIQTALLSDFTTFHEQLPGQKRYVDAPSGPGRGIGSTDEFFAETYQVPSWTLEIEPSNNSTPDRHPDLPGCGADYGGFATNCHDGFILPESEITRVRENLARTFPITYYHQAGPPSVTAVRWIDPVSGAVVVDAEWDVVSPTERQLYLSQLQPLALDQPYELWVAFDKPMRWRGDSGNVTALPGQSGANLSLSTSVSVGSATTRPPVGSFTWQDQPGGYYRYRDDAALVNFTLASADLAPGVNGDTLATLRVDTLDMVGLGIDADPSTPVDWVDGSWQGYENANGEAGDSGGEDSQISVTVTDASVPAPFVIEPGVSAAWFDPARSGEGFLIEVLDNNLVVIYWFTYDELGNQRWFTSTGQVRGNELYFPDLLVARGGIFGDSFDPAQVTLSVAGGASFVWQDCNTAAMRHNIDIRNQRQALTRLTSLNGLDCGGAAVGNADDTISGSWYDLTHAGEGFVVQALSDTRALIYWFTYNSQGEQAWIVADGVRDGNTVTVSDALITSGGVFGDGFDPDEVERLPWGSLTFEFGCANATVSYTSTLAEYGSGTQDLIRLTQLAGVDDCASSR